MSYLVKGIFKGNKPILLSVLVVLTCITTGYSQLSEQDLLNSLAVSDKQYYDSIYYELFKVTRTTDYVKAKMYASKSYHFAERFEHSVRYTKACRALSHAFSNLNQWDSAFYYSYTGIEASKEPKFRQTLMALLLDLGVLYDRQDKYDSAIKYYYQSNEIAERIGAKDGQSAISNNIGLIFYYMGNYEKALEYFKSSLLVKRENGILDDIPSNLLNIAIVHYDQGKYDEVLSMLLQADSICTNNCDLNTQSRINYGFGIFYFMKKDYDKSLYYYDRGIRLAKKGNIKTVIGYTQFYLSYFKIRDKDYNGAILLLKESEKVAWEISLKRLRRDIYEKYIMIYERLGKPQKVIEYQKKFMGIKDSIFNEQVAFNIAVLQLEAQKKQSDLVIQQKETELQRSQMIIALVVIIAILLILVVWLFYKRFRTNRRLREILEKQVRLRTSDLVQNNYELKQVNAEFETLLKQTSKNIRGPLATLMGLIDLVEKDQSDPQRTQEYITQIKKIAGSMGLSMDQLKEVGKIRGGNKATLDNLSAHSLEELLEIK